MWYTILFWYYVFYLIVEIVFIYRTRDFFTYERCVEDIPMSALFSKRFINIVIGIVTIFAVITAPLMCPFLFLYEDVMYKLGFDQEEDK